MRNIIYNIYIYIYVHYYILFTISISISIYLALPPVFLLLSNALSNANYVVFFCPYIDR